MSTERKSLIDSTPPTPAKVVEDARAKFARAANNPEQYTPEHIVLLLENFIDAKIAAAAAK